MPKHLLRRYIPTPERIAQVPGIHRLGPRITEPNLWHINRRSISGAMFWGILCAWIPLPSQMLIAAGCAVLFRVNLPLSVALTWISNPLTMVPVLYSSYWIGAHLFGIPMMNLHQLKDAVLSITSQLSGASSGTTALSDGPGFNIWALLTGLLTEALVLATLSYSLTQLFWRAHVMHEWRARKQRMRTD